MCKSLSTDIAVLSSYTALPDFIEGETKKETNEDKFYLCLKEIQALGETSELGGDALLLLQTSNPLPKWTKQTSVIIIITLLIYITILTI